MNPALLRHATAVDERPVRRNGRPAWRLTAVCSCGWRGPHRDDLTAAEDDSAAHLLEVQS